MSNSMSSITHRLAKPVPPDIININDTRGENILTITSDCVVIWGQPEKATEAAEMFTDTIVMTTERKAEIKQSRQEWEDRILAALISEAKNAPLTPEALTDVVRKCIMLDKLKGLK